MICNVLLPNPYDDVKLNHCQRYLNGVAVDDVVLLQNRKIRPICSECSTLSNILSKSLTIHGQNILVVIENGSTVFAQISDLFKTYTVYKNISNSV